jgi:REP-associated tyrosine transposase
LDAVLESNGYQEYWREEGEVWQREHWDRRFRSSESYASKWKYVRRNPVRYGLCEHPDDWPYQGELNILQW